jgi:hypothetical protein
LFFYRNGTGSREWPAEMLIPDQSAHLTKKKYKTKSNRYLSLIILFKLFS